MGVLSKVGGALNSLTGVSSAAAQSNKYAVQNAWLNHNMQKEFAQNAHQWEMADLKAAGLNPALTATGGSGASASGGGSFGGNTGSPAGNPFDIINGIVGMQNQTSATNSQNDLNLTAAIRNMAESNAVPQRVKNETMTAMANQINAQTNATSANTGTMGRIFGNKNTKETWKAGGNLIRNIFK